MTEENRQIDNAINKTICDENYIGVIKRYTIGLEEDTDDMLFFLPLSDLKNVRKKTRNELLDAIRNSCIALNYAILEDRDVTMEEYTEVGYDSHLFRIGKIA